MRIKILNWLWEIGIPSALITTAIYYLTHGHQSRVWLVWIFVGLVMGFDKNTERE